MNKRRDDLLLRDEAKGVSEDSGGGVIHNIYIPLEVAVTAGKPMKISFNDFSWVASTTPQVFNCKISRKQEAAVLREKSLDRSWKET